MTSLICTLTLALALTPSSSLFLITPVSPFSVKTMIISFYKEIKRGGTDSTPPNCSELHVKYVVPYQSVPQKMMPQILQTIIMELSTILKEKSCNLF